MALTRELKPSDPKPHALRRIPIEREVAVAYDGLERASVVAWRVAHPLKRLEVVEDFLLASSGTLPAPWATQDTSAAGSPTLDYVDDADGGEFQLLTDATDEAQNITLYWGDQLTIDVTKNAVFFARVKVDADAIPWSADQRMVIGLAAARNATLDSVAEHAWFRIEGASANILWETDDGTTDDDDNDTGVDIADNTYADFMIDLHDLAAVKFYINGQLVGSGDLSAATGNLQPFIEVQKDGGTETEDVRIDCIAVQWDR